MKTKSTKGARPSPICSACGDTHRMPSRPEWACTSCPPPCQRCRAGGNGPFCETTPCPCACHDGDPKYAGRRATPAPTAPRGSAHIAKIPRTLDVPVTFTLDRVELREQFDHAYDDEPFERTAVLEATFRSDGTDETIRGCADVTAIAFAPDGTPVDAAAWAGAVRAVLDSAIQEARTRVEELMTAGLEAERKEEG